MPSESKGFGRRSPSHTSLKSFIDENIDLSEEKKSQRGMLIDRQSNNSRTFLQNSVLPQDIDYMREGQFLLTNPKDIMERLKLGASQSALTRKLSQPKFKRH